MAMTLEQLNTAALSDALRALDGIYEHSPWIARQALAQRPLRSLAHLKSVMAAVVRNAEPEAQLQLIRAHPELAGKAMVGQQLTAESSQEQSAAGLTHCTPQEFERLQQLNTAYNTRFGFPFILAVRGPRGTGLTRQQIIDTLARRLHNHPDFERAEALRNIHSIAELRLNDRFGAEPVLGNEVWDWHEALARYSDPGYAEQGQLTVTYLTEAHRACARHLRDQMLECGFDEAQIDAVGNVVGRYHASAPGMRTLLMGSHYDTVRNGGKYDGRLGIFVPMACVRELHRAGKRLSYNIEVVAFAEEEGQRFKATFLGSSALLGQFDPAWLDQKDAQGISLRSAMTQAGVHIEQGPVLSELDLPLGVVTSINGSVRYLCEMVGMASHAGTTPMDRRRDAAVGVAELALYLEERANIDGDSVATVGLLNVPGGSINVVPGRCHFSIDLRAPPDAPRDALAHDVLTSLQRIAERRGLRCTVEEAMRASAAPS